MNPTTPFIILDDDDDDIQVTAVRKVQHSQPLPDHYQAAKNKANLGAYPEASSPSNSKGPEKTPESLQLLPSRDGTHKANTDINDSLELSVIAVKSVGIPHKCIDKELHSGPEKHVVKKRKRPQSPEPVQKNQRLSTENNPSNQNNLSEDDTVRSSIKAIKLSEDAGRPYTAKFFIDMVDTVANLFPFEEFAREHGCTTREVSRALSAVVVSPLMNPDLESLKDRCRASIAENGKRMIDKWQERYQDMIRTSGTSLDGTSEDSTCAAEEHGTIRSHQTNIPQLSAGASLSDTAANADSPSGPPETSRQRPPDNRQTVPSVHTSHHMSHTAGPQISGPARRWVRRDCFGNYVDIPHPDSAPFITERIPRQLSPPSSNFEQRGTRGRDDNEPRVSPIVKANTASKEISSGALQSDVEMSVSENEQARATVPDLTSAESVTAGMSSLEIDCTKSSQGTEGGTAEDPEK
ncbi:hypothetical protein VTN00DRAFT_6170 [Thermoascus crustaceus]|uniref:uncharacterized protein n=1 Tax=Thermoascus crustaceus TaxID=5088 RepID=UPI0037438DD8